jgi:hypothetical protein
LIQICGPRGAGACSGGSGEGWETVIEVGSAPVAGVQVAVGAVGQAALVGHVGDQTAAVGSLGAALSARLERTGALADLDEAIAAGREAVATTPDDHVDQVPNLTNLGAALAVRAELTRNRASPPRRLLAELDPAGGAP